MILVATTLHVGVLALSSSAEPPGEWPMIRHDSRNTAASPLKGRMHTVPVTQAVYSLGGSPSVEYLLLDCNGDGLEEVVTVAGVVVRALKGNGETIWRTLLPRGSSNLLGAGDLDGDGFTEIVCATSVPATAYVLSGRDGRVLWERTFDEQVSFANGCRVADLDGDGRPDLFLLGNAPAVNSRRLGWAFRFRGGCGNPEMIWGGLPLPFNPHYRPQSILADVDGDGVQEIVMASALHAEGVGLVLAALDPLTGRVKRTVAFPNGDRNYGHLQAIRTGSKPQLDLLVVGMLGRPHMTFLTNDAKGIREVWHTCDTMQIPENPVADIDGDGKLEVVYTRIGTEGKQPTAKDAVIIIRDLLTGPIKRELPGRRLRGLVDLNGDGRLEMVAEAVPQGGLLFYVGEPGKERAFPQAAVKPCLVANRPSLHMMNETLEERSGYNLFACDLDGDGIPEVLVSTPEGLLALDGRTLAVKVRYPLDKIGEAQVLGAGNLARRREPTLLLASDNGLLFLSGDGKKRDLARVNHCPPRTPIVARLRRRSVPAVLLSRPNGAAVALDGPGLIRGQVKVLWTLPSLGGFEAPTVADVDGDGQPEAILCDLAMAEPVLVDAAGKIKRRLSPLPTDGTPLVTGTCVVGKFGPSGRLALGAVSGVGPNDSLARWTILDPQSGRVIWQRQEGCHPRRTPCVVDLNGDGVEDLAWVHYFDLMAVDGRTDANLWSVRDIVPGYHVVAAADVEGPGSLSLLLSGGYMGIYRFGLNGRRIWATPPLNYDAGSAGALADIDSDGRLELGTAFSNRFACYDAASGKVKWSLPLPGRGSDVTAADVDGCGRPEFLFGCANGRLYAVRAVPSGARGEILWSVALGAPVGPPAIADVDGDGWAEILVVTQDGWLHVLSSSAARIP
jgi:outer membrane protein assembly factor BamB